MSIITPQILLDIRKDLQNVYVISDTHFRHNNILSFEPIRAQILEMVGKEVNIDNHDEFIIQQWNKTVSDNDIVIHLGDVSWKSPQHILPQLHGRKILILGNHDSKGDQIYKDFEYIVRGFQDISNGYLQITHNTDRLFSCLKVGEYFFSHYPLKEEEPKEGMRNLDSLNRINNRVKDMLSVLRYYTKIINIHGHIHSDVIINNKHIKYHNVSCEKLGLTPMKLSKVLK